MQGSVSKSNLSEALLGQVRSSILALLFCNSERSFYHREIVRSLGKGQGAVQRELDHLVRSGLITRNKVGNQVHYQANTESAIFPELKSLMIKTAGVADLLREALEPLKERTSVAFVYGSFAKGTESADSDVDVMVIGEIEFGEVADLLGRLQVRMGREVNPSVYPADEFTAKISEGNHFLTRLIEEPKIFLIGDEDEFGKLVEKRLAD